MSKFKKNLCFLVILIWIYLKIIKVHFLGIVMWIFKFCCEFFLRIPKLPCYSIPPWNNELSLKTQLYRRAKKHFELSLNNWIFNVQKKKRYSTKILKFFDWLWTIFLNNLFKSSNFFWRCKKKYFIQIS